MPFLLSCIHCCRTDTALQKLVKILNMSKVSEARGIIEEAEAETVVNMDLVRLHKSFIILILISINIYTYT